MISKADKGDIVEAKKSQENQSLVAIKENHARVRATNNHSSISCFTNTPAENAKEACCSENDHQEESSPLQNVASSSLDCRNERSEKAKRKSQDKHLTAGAKGQGNESTKITRCKLPFENRTIFIALIITRCFNR